MAWLAVSKYGYEYIFHNKPIRCNNVFWHDKKSYDEYRIYTASADDKSIALPRGSIERLTGKKLTWKDEPIEI